MKTFKRKELQSTVQEALSQVIGTFHIEKPSKKTARIIEKTSKKLSKEFKDELKKQIKKMEKAQKNSAKQEVLIAS